MGRACGLGWLVVVILAAGLAAIGAWAASDAAAAESRFRWLVSAIALWSAAACAALHFWLHQFCGSVQWNGYEWLLVTENVTSTDRRVGSIRGHPEVLADLQSHVWVCLSTVGGGRLWIWLERSREPGRWLDLRRALYSPAPLGANVADQPDAAGGRGP